MSGGEFGRPGDGQAVPLAREYLAQHTPDERPATGSRLHADTVATIREVASWLPPQDSIRAKLRVCADRLAADAEREREALAAGDELAAAANQMIAGGISYAQAEGALIRAVKRWQGFR